MPSKPASASSIQGESRGTGVAGGVTTGGTVTATAAFGQLAPSLLLDEGAADRRVRWPVVRLIWKKPLPLLATPNKPLVPEN